MALPMLKFVVHLALVTVAASSPAKLCGLAGYQTTNLTQASYWIIDQMSSDCIPGVNATCQLYLTFCQSLTSEGQPFDDTCDGAGACLVTPQSVNKTTYDIGAYSNISSQFKQKTYVDGAGFIYDYPDGEEFSCGTVSTLVNFVCDFKKPWIPNPEKATPVPYPAVVKFLSKECMYNITVPYSGACYTITPSQPADSSLSAGSILLIIFIPAIALYFIIGCLINRVRGHQGEEILPHHEFWCGLPGYIRDGMKYVWAVVTCKNTDAEAKGYGSI